MNSTLDPLAVNVARRHVAAVAGPNPADLAAPLALLSASLQDELGHLRDAVQDMEVALVVYSNRLRDDPLSAQDFLLGLEHDLGRGVERVQATFEVLVAALARTGRELDRYFTETSGQE